MADKPLTKIANSIKRKGTKGVFSAKAKAAGMSTHAYAEKEKGAKGKLGKEARVALMFEKARKK